MAFQSPLVMLRGCLVGVFVGAVPGVGSSVSNLLSYVETKRRDPDPDSFGKGNPKGIVASESANSTSEAGSMATLLALGIPGGWRNGGDVSGLCHAQYHGRSSVYS